MLPGDIHGGLMIAGFLVLFLGFLTARLMKKKKWWLKAHQTFGLFGVSLTILSFIVIVYRFSFFNLSQYKLLHVYAGLVIVILTAAMPVLGFMQLKIRKAAGKIRPMHRSIGWIILIAMFINITLGIFMADII